MNVNPIFAQNVDYVFYAQQAVERYSIERQISMSMSHGGLTTNEKGFGEEHSTYEYIVEGELNLNDGNLVKRFPNFGLEWEIHFTMSIDNELPDGVTPSMSITGDFKLCSLILIIVNNLNKKDRY